MLPMSVRYTFTYDQKDRPFFEKVWDLLVEHAGASKSPDNKESFVLAYTQREHKATEFRCCSAFGFGGKFWRANGSFYVTCYPEDRTPKRNSQIERLNVLLKTLAIEMQANPEGP